MTKITEIRDLLKELDDGVQHVSSRALLIEKRVNIEANARSDHDLTPDRMKQVIHAQEARATSPPK